MWGRAAPRNKGHAGFVLEPRTPGSLSFAPKVPTSSTSVGKQPGCGEEIQLCPVASAPCVPHLPYTQHVSVIKGIKTSKAAAGRSFVMCSVPVPEDSCGLPRVLAGAELSKDPVFSGGQSSEHCWDLPGEESRSRSWHWAFPSPPHIPHRVLSCLPSSWCPWLQPCLSPSSSFHHIQQPLLPLLPPSPAYIIKKSLWHLPCQQAAVYLLYH